MAARGGFRRWAVALVTAAAVAVLVVVGVIAFRSPSDTAGAGQADGPPTSVSPTAFVLPALNGAGQVRLADSRGTPTVVNFFASWCSECDAELPGFAAVSAQLRGKVTFVGVNALETGDPNLMPTRHGITWWPLARDVGGRQGSGLHDALGGGTGMPITAFYASDGTLITVHRGALAEDELRRTISQLYALPSS